MTELIPALETETPEGSLGKNVLRIRLVAPKKRAQTQMSHLNDNSSARIVVSLKSDRHAVLLEF